MRRFLIFLMLFSAPARAQEGLPPVIGNMPSGFYPVPPCAKPTKPVFRVKDFAPRPGEIAGQMLGYDIGEHNRKIAEFNKAVAAYNSCAKTYIENSRYDIERILSTVNTEVAEVRGTDPPRPPTGTGNLPANFYPRSRCVKPDQSTIGVQPATNDLKAMAAYNRQVEAFNQQALTFSVCLKTYQDKAQYDIQEIEAAVQPATAHAVQGEAREKP
jgi:hypothetical protein